MLIRDCAVTRSCRMNRDSAGLTGSNALEVLTMGRICVDLYPEQIGVELPDVRTSERRHLG